MLIKSQVNNPKLSGGYEDEDDDDDASREQDEKRKKKEGFRVGLVFK